MQPCCCPSPSICTPECGNMTSSSTATNGEPMPLWKIACFLTCNGCHGALSNFVHQCRAYPSRRTFDQRWAALVADALCWKPGSVLFHDLPCCWGDHWCQPVLLGRPCKPRHFQDLVFLPQDLCSICIPVPALRIVFSVLGQSYCNGYCISSIRHHSPGF